jgi:uncharacterized protein (DUF924 family)
VSEVRSADVLAFWFDGPDDADHGKRRKAWFIKDPAFDAEIRARFLERIEQAARGQFDDWREDAHGALALVIVLDQFSRNVYRDTSSSFANDAKALAVAHQAVDRGFDQALTPLERVFLYLPFEHSEDVAMQERSLRLFSALTAQPGFDEYFDYAKRHHAVIARFGRFPHRNRILARESTPQELEFLAQPGSSF